MAANDVFRKTAKGTAEIAARSIKLAPMTRMAMVMVDGVKPFAELCAKLGGEAPAQAAITELLGHGLVELHAADGASSAHAAAPSAIAPAPAPAMPFDELRRWATRAASQAMGPMGDDYCLRIERAKTAAELDAAVERARNGVDAITNSRAKSAAYWDEYVKNRGG